MSRTVEFFFDVGSPATYLAWTQLPRIAAATGARIRWRPMLLGGVFKATGNQSPMMVPAKGAYMARDLMRFARRYDVPFRFNPHFPINTLTLMRGAQAYLDTDRFDAYLRAVFEGLWARERNLGDPAVVAATLPAAGIDPADFERRVSDQAVKDALKATTEEAVGRGVFGAPTFFIGDEMFFGQDRLDWIERALTD